MKKIVVFDYSTGIVHVLDYDENIFEEVEDFFDHANTELGLPLTTSQTHWMIVDELNIKVW